MISTQAPDSAVAERRLRTVLATNATTSGLGGLAAVLFAGPLDEVLGTGSLGWIRLVGVGLAVFAAYVAWVSRSHRSRLAREAPGISIGDAGWVVGTIVAIALGWFSTGGAVLMALVAAMVGAFAVAQAGFVRAIAGRAAAMPAAS